MGLLNCGGNRISKKKKKKKKKNTDKKIHQGVLFYLCISIIWRDINAFEKPSSYGTAF